MYRLPKFGYTRGFDKVWFIHGHEGDHDYFKKDPLYHFKPEDFVEEHVINEAAKRGREKLLGPMMEEMETHLRESQHWRTDEDHMVAKSHEVGGGLPETSRPQQAVLPLG